MPARMLALAAAFALAACTPPAPPAPANEEAADDPYLAALASAPVPGAWSARGDNDAISACFGAPDAACRLAIVCHRPTGVLTVRYAHALAPDQHTVLRIFTETMTLDLPADSTNRGQPMVTAELVGLAGASHQPLIHTLAPPQERFGVEVAGETAIFPWDQSIPRTLAECPPG